ncbi:transporter [Ganoderma sinense ZZ0214-1]|uniref:Transporter n=1 Tax=Ganoderma sinense ZZ0214-1 TaxID=1077348 RepID=A0A2G8SQS8_9APHY|nr:transporter [Ganoderma sinense ZZ0214-1]
MTASMQESEKKAQREWYKFESSRAAPTGFSETREQPPEPVNTSLHQLLDSVSNATDPWLLFLKAVFLCRLSRREEAIESAILSISQYPWNWSAWVALGDCLCDGDELSSMLPLLPLPASHPLVLMFQVKTLNTLNSPTDNELALCDRLLSEDFFPRSMWIMALRGNVLYYLHDFTSAEAQFRKILAIDPYRVDDIDILSNILYVTENGTALSKLAHDYLAINKDRPEICCIIGNYYSLRAEHEKAVKYFKRATQLDRTYLAAWTLMGHEYVEMKNSHAAIEAYRKAVDVNRKDYRAWYGLAQAYELLSMHQYALYYYQHATALRPYDVRIWQAQGMCYEEMGRLRDAIECLRRALIGADPEETVIHSKLAKLHNELEEYAEAAAYHRRIVEVCRAAHKPVPEWSKSAVYIARYHIQHGGGDFVLARQYLDFVATSNAEEVTQANEMLRRYQHVLRQQQNPQVRAASEGPQVA